MSLASVFTFLTEGFGLLKLILTEVYERKKARRLANQEYELTKAEMLEISQLCLNKMREQLLREQKEAHDIDDQMDNHKGF